MGVAPSDLERGRPLEELRARWRAFLKPGDVALAWNESTIELMQQLCTPLPSVCLKAAYRGWRGERAQPGALEAVVRAEGLHVARVPLAGRAGERLGHAEAGARALHVAGESASG